MCSHDVHGPELLPAQARKEIVGLQRAHREEGERGEGLGGGELVAQEDVDAEGEDGDEHGDGVEGEAEEGLDDEAAPQRAQLLVAHALDAVPHGPLHAPAHTTLSAARDIEDRRIGVHMQQGCTLHSTDRMLSR